MTKTSEIEVEGEKEEKEEGGGGEEEEEEQQQQDKEDDALYGSVACYLQERLDYTGTKPLSSSVSSVTSEHPDPTQVDTVAVAAVTNADANQPAPQSPPPTEENNLHEMDVEGPPNNEQDENDNVINLADDDTDDNGPAPPAPRAIITSGSFSDMLDVQVAKTIPCPNLERATNQFLGILGRGEQVPQVPRCLPPHVVQHVSSYLYPCRFFPSKKGIFEPLPENLLKELNMHLLNHPMEAKVIPYEVIFFSLASFPHTTFHPLIPNLSHPPQQAAGYHQPTYPPATQLPPPTYPHHQQSQPPYPH